MFALKMRIKIMQLQKIVMVVTVCSLSLFARAEPVQSEWTFEILTKPRGIICGGQFGGAEDTARMRSFDAIWQERKTRNVTLDIIPFLDDTSSSIRFRAVQALGLLENPRAIEPLEAQMEFGGKSSPVGSIPSITYDLALGRIASRNFKGQDKVATLAEQVGLSWPDLVRLSQKINDDKDRYSMQNTVGEQVMEEVVDLLYTMGKRGENVGPIAQQLTLLPAQQVQIEASTLDDAKESEAILDHFMQLNVIRGEEYRLSNHLVRLGTVATSAILARLEEMKRDPRPFQGLEPYPGYPGAFRSHLGGDIILRTASGIDDPRLMPLFQHFTKSSDKEVRREAEMAIQNAKLRVRFKELEKS